MSGAFALFLIVGCRRHSGAQLDGGAAASPQLAALGAPDHATCTADADCTFWLELDETTCCFDAARAGAQSAAYMRWTSTRVASRECQAAHCAPLPLPAPPPTGACWNTPRCTAGRCTDACGDR